MSRYEPTTLGIPSRMPRREFLTGQTDGERIHAIYPTGLVTLCGLERGDASAATREPPTCLTCVETARAFDLIDKSCPDHWGYLVTPEAA